MSSQIYATAVLNSSIDPVYSSLEIWLNLFTSSLKSMPIFDHVFKLKRTVKMLYETVISICKYFIVLAEACQNLKTNTRYFWENSFVSIKS